MTRGEVLCEALLANDVLHIFWYVRLLGRPGVYRGHFGTRPKSERVEELDRFGALWTLLLLDDVFNFFHSVRDEL